MTRILIVATWYPSARDPIGGIFVEDQAVALAKDHDVAVIAPDMRRLVRSPWEGLPRGLTTERRSGIPVVRPGVIGIATWRQAGWSYRRAVERAYRRLEQSWGRPDVIHAHVVFPGGWSAVQLGRRLGVPVVLTEHSSPFSARLTTPWLRRQVRWTLEHADRRIAVSPGLRDQIRQFAALDIEVVGNVCDTDFFSPAENGGPRSRPDRRFRFLTIGLLTPQKGVDVLLLAARRLLELMPERWELIIGGDGPSRSRLQLQASELGLDSHCRFVGSLSREQTRDWMRWSDAFVLASRHETFGMVVVEALACGKPVIASASGGPEHILTEEVGLLVEPGDVSMLADAMATALRGEFRPLPAAARAIAVGRFGPQAFVNRMTEIYAGLGAPARTLMGG